MAAWIFFVIWRCAVREKLWSSTLSIYINQLELSSIFVTTVKDKTSPGCCNYLAWFDTVAGKRDMDPTVFTPNGISAMVRQGRHLRAFHFLRSTLVCVVHLSSQPHGPPWLFYQVLLQIPLHLITRLFVSQSHSFDDAALLVNTHQVFCTDCGVYVNTDKTSTPSTPERPEV